MSKDTFFEQREREVIEASRIAEQVFYNRQAELNGIIQHTPSAPQPNSGN
jgi:hypothetical protein